ncbi:MAG: FAD-dependent oxidoreductase [Phycisphaeraceae bacterium]|nr:FAD-dependent oxidoreductase [Phycisphaeraceae bacterium]
MADHDVAIIGGGIHGVGVAQAASIRGYKTILIEQYDELAQGTSSRSSKLIHGGLRYLEQFNFSLVRECLLERSYLLENAPHLVKLKPVYIPVYKDSKRSPWMIRAGLSMYALLGNLASDARFKKIPKSKWCDLHNLNVNNLQAVYQYYEAQTDDRLLTQAVMSSAQAYGAELMLNTKVSAIQLQDNYSTITCRTAGQQDKIITSTTIINAAGPWVAKVLDQVQPKQKTLDIDLVQGAHIVLPLRLGEVIFYLESPDDKRPVFVMPWYGDTMIGTTESLFTKDPGDTTPLDKEVEYLQRAFSHHFPTYNKQQSVIKHQFSGLRVLPSGSDAANQRSRETIYLRDRKTKPRLLSIFGGKLTSYRATSEQVMCYLQESLPEPQPHTETKYLKLK